MRPSASAQVCTTCAAHKPAAHKGCIRQAADVAEAFRDTCLASRCVRPSMTSCTLSLQAAAPPVRRLGGVVGGGTQLLTYLVDAVAMDNMLVPYPILRSRAQCMWSAESAAHPSSSWRIGRSRLSAFLSRATRADDPAPKLRVLEAALRSKQVRNLTTTDAEHEFRDKLSELLLVSALVGSQFICHGLPRTSEKNPDVTGHLPGLGTLSLEVYQPADHASKEAYMSELTDAVELADTPWNYTAIIDWHEERPRPDLETDRSHRERHSRIRGTINELFPERDRPTDAIRSRCTDAEAGLSADVRLVNVEPWSDPQLPMTRATSRSWSNHPWIVENDAEAVATRS